MLAAVFALMLAATPACHSLQIRPAEAGGRSPAIATQADVTGARVSVTEGQVVLNIDLSKGAGARLKQYTAGHVGSKMAFVFDGRVVQTPKILDPIQVDGFLVGPFERSDADRYASQINDGAAACLKGR